jgi:hypothetical protein
MDSQKQFTGPEIQFLLSCSEADENEMINCEEFANRFQEPARDIGFNVAVLLTNLSEHVPHDPRLRNFLELAESILEYFRPYLGRIEIMGASRRIERIYFEISETNRAQWEMPQVSRPCVFMKPWYPENPLWGCIHLQCLHLTYRALTSPGPSPNVLTHHIWLWLFWESNAGLPAC